MKKLFISSVIAVLACLISFDLFAAECTGISFDPTLDYYTEDDEETGYTYYYPNSLETIYLEGIPEEYIGLLSLGFYSNSQSQSWTSYASVGTYDLGSGDNSNYSSCHQCVMLDLYDWNNDYAYVSSFYQKEGTLKITRTDFVANDHYYYEGLLSVKLAEAEIDEESFETSFVENGDCYEIESAAWTVFPDDGDTGSDDPTDTGSDEPGECTGISFDPALDYYTEDDEETGYTYYYPNSLETIYLEGLPEEYIGLLSLGFYSGSQSESWTNYAAVGTYDLASGDNGDYSSCHQCVMLDLYDLNNDYAYVSSFFQQEGTLKVTRTDFVANDHYYYEGVLSVKLAEAEIDEETYESEFVENGACFEIESAAWTVFPDEGDSGSEDPTDTGSEPTDTGSEPTDTGSEDPTDTGSEPTDTGSEDPTDTGSEDPTDTGSEDPTDTGDTEVPGDGGDTGTEPTDTGSDDEPTDGDNTPTDEGKKSSGCALVTL
ncbi:hypothetical protein J5834_03325 [bacterium]|nr:hypothetical protein [bacterium]